MYIYRDECDNCFRYSLYVESYSSYRCVNKLSCHSESIKVNTYIAYFQKVIRRSSSRFLLEDLNYVTEVLYENGYKKNFLCKVLSRLYQKENIKKLKCTKKEILDRFVNDHKCYIIENLVGVFVKVIYNL